jgi:ribosomal protein S18 acetylase RimI-like enzyme
VTVARSLDVRDPAIAAQVVDVQRAAYRVEADLIGNDAIPALHESQADVAASGEDFRGVHVDGRLAALLSTEWDAGALTICRLAVHPGFSRRGLGSLLVHEAVAGAGGARVRVSTGSANAPALALYARLGFTPIAEREPVPGLRITVLERAAELAA